jgi:hypothetical protein
VFTGIIFNQFDAYRQFMIPLGINCVAKSDESVKFAAAWMDMFRGNAHFFHIMKTCSQI